MNKRSFLFLLSFIGLFFVISAEAEDKTFLAKSALIDSTEFVVKEDWIACYKDKNGTPSDDIVEIFYSGDSIFPQHWQHWAPYTEHQNQLYLWVKYNDTPAVGCFVEATTENISVTKTASAENIAPADTAAAINNSENTPPANSASVENTAPADTATESIPENAPPSEIASSENQSSESGTPIESVPLVNSASTKTSPSLGGNVDKALKIKCAAPGTTAIRRLETSYDNFPATLPCKVVYYREDGKTQVIAEAKATEGYCVEKRNEFIERLKGWGWQCK